VRVPCVCCSPTRYPRFSFWLSTVPITIGLLSGNKNPNSQVPVTQVTVAVTGRCEKIDLAKIRLDSQCIRTAPARLEGILVRLFWVPKSLHIYFSISSHLPDGKFTVIMYWQFLRYFPVRPWVCRRGACRLYTRSPEGCRWVRVNEWFDSLVWLLQVLPITSRRMTPSAFRY
jgi:hypothetical protein